MTEPEYYSFDDAAVSSVLEAARQPYAETNLREISEISLVETPKLTLLAQCLSVVVRNNRICLRLPLGLGSVCLPIPFNIPNGTAAKACLSICTIFGIPTGVCVRITVGGVTIVNKCFGFGC